MLYIICLNDEILYTSSNNRKKIQVIYDDKVNNHNPLNINVNKEEINEWIKINKDRTEEKDIRKAEREEEEKMKERRKNKERKRKENKVVREEGRRK